MLYTKNNTDLACYILNIYDLSTNFNNFLQEIAWSLSYHKRS